MKLRITSVAISCQHQVISNSKCIIFFWIEPSSIEILIPIIFSNTSIQILFLRHLYCFLSLEVLFCHLNGAEFSTENAVYLYVV